MNWCEGGAFLSKRSRLSRGGHDPQQCASCLFPSEDRYSGLDVGVGRQDRGG